MNSKFKDATELKIEFQKKLISHQVWYSCINCEEFDKENEICKLHKLRPPAHIIVTGCKDYMGDVPF